jgi:hypothetical protein
LQWSFGDGNTSTDYEPIHTYAVDLYEQDYSFVVCLELLSPDSCYSDTCATIDLIGYRLNVPNAFSPELDYNLVNDANVFLPKGHSLTKYHVQVFDGWGNVVFESSALSDLGIPLLGWNGKYMNNGKDLPMGAYVWKIEAEFEQGIPWRGVRYSNGRFEKYGTVTLIR